jgi:hypothetical protein
MADTEAKRVQAEAEKAECLAALVEQFERTMPEYREDLSDGANIARMEAWMAARRRAGLED